MISRVRRARGAALVAFVAAAAWTLVGCSDGGKKLPVPSPSATGDAAGSAKDDEGVSWIDGTPVVPGYGVGEFPPVPTYEFPENLNALLALSSSDVDLGALTKSYPGMTVTAADCTQHDVDQVTSSDGKITWDQSSDGSLYYDDADVSLSIGADHKSGSYRDDTTTYYNAGDGSGSYEDDLVDTYVVSNDDGTFASGATFTDGRHFANLGGGSGFYESSDAADADQFGPGDFIIHNFGDGSGLYEDAYIYVSNSGDGTGFVQLKSTEKYYDTTVDPLPKMPEVAPLPPLDPNASAVFCGVSLQVDSALLFDFGSSTLRSSSLGMLDSVAKALLDNDVPKAVIEGHTDAVGDPAANQTLSEQRAQAVVDALKTRGVTTELVPVGYGSTHPVASETTPEGADDPAGRQLNRRVEIFIPDF